MAGLHADGNNPAEGEVVMRGMMGEKLERCP